MSELKPCPFCGSDAKLHEDDDGKMFPWVVCSGCHCETNYYDTIEEAIAAWNRRAVKCCVECKHYPPAKVDGSETACPMWDNGDDGWAAHWNGDEFGFCHKWEVKE